MKTMILFATIILTTTLAHADPTDNDPLTVVDDGATLTVLREINIPSHNKVLYQSGSQFAFYSQVSNGQPFCRLYAENFTFNDYERDIAVNVGRTLIQISHHGPDNINAATLEFRLSDGGTLYFNCFSGMVDGISAGIPSIGQFKRAISGWAELKLASPLAL